MKSSLHTALPRLSLLLIPLVLGCPAVRQAASEAGTTSPTAPRDKSLQEVLPPESTSSALTGTLDVAQRLTTDSLQWKQQSIIAKEIGNAIRAYDASHGRLPETTAELVSAKLLFTSLRRPDGSPCPLVTQAEPWSYYLDLSSGSRHWQLHRSATSGSPNMVHEPIANAVDGMPVELRQRLPIVTAAKLLPATQRPTDPAPMSAFPADAGKYLERSNDLRDAQIAAFESSVRNQLQCYVELQGNLPQSWEELQLGLGVSSMADFALKPKPSDKLWAPDEAGLVVMRDAAGHYFRVIRKASAAAVADDIYKINQPTTPGVGVYTGTWLDESEIGGIAWLPLLSVSAGT